MSHAHLLTNVNRSNRSVKQIKYHRLLFNVTLFKSTLGPAYNLLITGSATTNTFFSCAESSVVTSSAYDMSGN